MMSTIRAPSPSDVSEEAIYDSSKWRKGHKVHTAVVTLGHLLVLVVTPAHEQNRDHAE